MTVDDASRIQSELFQLESPALYMALQFAFFKTFGIPTISRTLVKTGQLSSDEFASKRGANTGVIMSEMSINAPDSSRAVEAMARMNQLHAPYQKSGAILNDDLLYTLGLFMFEPIRFVNKYEWREFSGFVICARGCQWKAVGDAMGIEYSVLSGEASGQGWRDGLDWAQALEAWSEAYERRNMTAAESNKLVTEQAVQLLLATRHETPPSWAPTTINIVFHTRRFMLRHLSLPRPDFLRVQYVTTEANTKSQ